MLSIIVNNFLFTEISSVIQVIMADSSHKMTVCVSLS